MGTIALILFWTFVGFVAGAARERVLNERIFFTKNHMKKAIDFGNENVFVTPVDKTIRVDEFIEQVKTNETKDL